MSKRYADGDGDSQPKRRRNEGPVPPMFKVFHGEVASVKEYGLFVKIPGGTRQGLVHKSQISRSKVDDPSEMFARGEYVYCKVISINDEGEKIGLAMKMVNQTTGQDQDPNNVELSQDEKKRKQFGNRRGQDKIVLEAVFDTTCKKCGGQGHLAQDCFKTGESSYDLIPDLDDYMQAQRQAPTHSQPSSTKKKKKDKKKKEKKKKKHRRSSSTSDSSSSDTDKHNREKSKSRLKKKKKHRKVSSSSDSDKSSSEDRHKKQKHRHKQSPVKDTDRNKHRRKKEEKKRRRKYSSSSSSSSER